MPAKLNDAAAAAVANTGTQAQTAPTISGTAAAAAAFESISPRKANQSSSGASGAHHLDTQSRIPLLQLPLPPLLLMLSSGEHRW